MWKTIKQNFIKTFFPKFCLNCQKEGCIICYDCFSLIDINEFQFCPFCQKPNRVIGKGKCKKHRNFSLDGIFTAVDYKNQLVKKMITSLKYKPFLKELAEPLSNLMITHLIISKNQIIPQAKNIMAIIPVPLYIKKEKQRGFNHSLLIADNLARSLQLPLLSDNLLRIKNTPSQVGLSKMQRWQNLSNAFFVKNPQLIQGKIIFLIDDVFTTGATMEECASVLKKADAKQVWGITTARESLGN